jgi:signal transduction histidine kinase/ligand-binding sensor domain-containing protein
MKASNTSHCFPSAKAAIKYFLLFLLLAVCNPATAQFHTIFQYSVPDGLPSSEVYEVYEDKQGFLWFATDNGVARYDGKDFRTFHVKDGLTDPVVFGFFEDERNRIWFRTFSGKLCYFNGKKIETYKYNNQLTKSVEWGLFNFIYDTETDDLWFTLGHILGKIDSKGKVTTQEIYRPSVFFKEINGKLIQGNDTKFSVQNIIINEKRFPIELTDSTDHNYFRSIVCGDKMYFSIYKDVFEYDSHTVKRVFTGKHPIISLSKDREENLWIGFLNHGVLRYRTDNNAWNLDFLSKKSVTKVLQDMSGGFWFTTLESGVYYLPDSEIKNYSLPTSARLKAVLALDDTVMIGDQSGNLFYLDADSKSVLSKKKYKHGIYGLFQDAFKNVWICAGVDINRFNSKFERKNRYRKLIATSFAEGSDGSVFALGGIRITHFDKAGRLVKSRARRKIYRGIHVEDSIIYLAGRTGLDVRSKEMELITTSPALAEFKITRIESLNDTTLILATQGNGLLLVNKHTWKYRQFDIRNQFLANNIYCLTKTDSTLWMGTEKGIVAIPLDNLLKNDATFFHVSHRRGLLSNKINFILPVKETIWAFSDEGFSVLSTSYADSARSKPVFYLKSVTTPVDILTSFEEVAAAPVVLPHDMNHISFAFGYISFTNQDLFLRYRITAGNDWITSSERTVQFSSLAPGNFLFELQYSIDNRRWSAPFEPIPFTVDSPWWRKWYIQAAVLVFLLLIGYVYFHYHQSMYKQKNHFLSIINTQQQKLIQSEIETLEKERNRIAKELHDGVGTNLTAIKLMVNRLLQNHQEPRTRDVEEQFQIALKELKDIIYGLTPPSLERYGLFTALKNYIQKLNDTLAPQISLQAFGQEINHYEFNIMVFRIVQELISNSLKHSSASHITIHLNSFEELMNIVYEDDGVGFSYDSSAQGLGLDNIETRIQSLNGTLKFDSGKHGICYTIDIPLHSIRQPV